MSDNKLPTVVELKDNIDTSDIVAKNDPTTAPKLTMMNISQACEIIAAKYKRGFEHLKFTLPAQVFDGCLVEFIDSDLHVIVATGKLRFISHVSINSDGELILLLKVSDISFERPFADLSVKYKS